MKKRGSMPTSVGQQFTTNVHQVWQMMELTTYIFEVPEERWVSVWRACQQLLLQLHSRAAGCVSGPGNRNKHNTIQATERQMLSQFTFKAGNCKFLLNFRNSHIFANGNNHQRTVHMEPDWQLRLSAYRVCNLFITQCLKTPVNKSTY